jgi:hypothetical protein
MTQRVGALLLTTVVATISGLAALVGAFWGFNLKCDDSCSVAPPWRNDPSAWQWNALGVVAVGGFVSSLVLVALVAARRRSLAGAALVSWGLFAVGFVTLFRASGMTSHAERGWLAIVGVAVAGFAAIALTPRRDRH